MDRRLWPPFRDAHVRPTASPLKVGTCLIATGVITNEMTMLGSIVTAFAWFLRGENERRVHLVDEFLRSENPIRM